MKFLILYNIRIEKFRYNNKEMKNEYIRARTETLPCILTELWLLFLRSDEIYPVFTHCLNITVRNPHTIKT